MKWIKSIITAISIMFAGMAGGQGKIGGKAPRRFGISIIALLSSWASGFRIKDLALLLLIPILSMGYGVDSTLYNALFQNEILTRFVYAGLVSLPFLIYGAKRWYIAFIGLVMAFQVRAGSLGHISWFGDVLIEDICRYLILGLLISFNIFFRKKD